MAKEQIPLEQLDPSRWNLTAQVRVHVDRLLNRLEELTIENEQLKQENARLRARLAKFERQVPAPAPKPNKDRSDDSQKKIEDKKKKRRKKIQRSQSIRIDREVKIPLDRQELPDDFKSTGYRDVTVQNIAFRTDNVRFHLERGSSPSTGRFYEAKLPEGVRPGYGVELEAFVIMLYYQLRVTQPKIHSMLTSLGIVISRAQIAEVLTRKHFDRFEAERQAVLAAGLFATPYQQIDDTAMRVDGVGHHVITLCSPFYSCFFTRRYKNADTVASLLSELDEGTVLADWVEMLIGDDAPQFHNQTTYRGLCWIHEERLYGKLRPFFRKHQKLLDDFRTKIWDYYKKLGAYAENPSEKRKQRLSEEFDELFSTTTGYDELDHRIELTRAKKDRLLLVLEFPEVPRENNESERTLREWVIKRNISRGTRSPTGTKAWDTFLSLVDTCRKRGRQFYQYVVDCLCGRKAGSLACSILEAADVDDPEFEEHLKQMASVKRVE